jgi:YD repeat-containing protein
MARNDVVNTDGSINYTTIGGFKDRLDGHDISLAQKAQQVDLNDVFTVNNHTVAYAYNTDGSVHSITEQDSSNNVVKTVTYSYDTNGNVISNVTTMNGHTVTTTYIYDINGNITSTSNVIS